MGLQRKLILVAAPVLCVAIWAWAEETPPPAAEIRHEQPTRMDRHEFTKEELREALQKAATKSRPEN